MHLPIKLIPFRSVLHRLLDVPAAGRRTCLKSSRRCWCTGAGRQWSKSDTSRRWVRRRTVWSSPSWRTLPALSWCIVWIVAPRSHRRQSSRRARPTSTPWCSPAVVADGPSPVTSTRLLDGRRCVPGRSTRRHDVRRTADRSVWRSVVSQWHRASTIPSWSAHFADRRDVAF